MLKDARNQVILCLKKKYKERGLFWSHPYTSFEQIPDETFIDKVFHFGTDDELYTIKSLYPAKILLSVWNKGISGESSVNNASKRKINLATKVFNAKDPEKFVYKHFLKNNPYERSKRLT